MNELHESVMRAMAWLSGQQCHWSTVDEIMVKVGAHKHFVPVYERALWELRDLGLVEWGRAAPVRFSLSTAGWGFVDSLGDAA